MPGFRAGSDRRLHVRSFFLATKPDCRNPPCSVIYQSEGHVRFRELDDGTETTDMGAKLPWLRSGMSHDPACDKEQIKTACPGFEPARSVWTKYLPSRRRPSSLI